MVFLFFGILTIIPLFIIALILSWAFEDMKNKKLGDLFFSIIFICIAIFFVGIWFSAAEHGEISILPLWEIYAVFTFIGILCILFAVSYYFVEKYMDKIEKIFKWMLHHPVKALLSGFSVGSIIITVIAYILGIQTVNHYNLSWDFVIPQAAQAIPVFLLSISLLVTLSAFPFLIYSSINKDKKSHKKKTIGYYVLWILGFGCLSSILILIFYIVLSINIHAVLISNTTITIIIFSILFLCIFISLLLLFLLESGAIKTQEQFGSKNTSLCYSVTKNNVQKIKIKSIIITCFAVSYTIISVISIISFGKIVFSPNSGKNEYEYVTTEEYGDCVILMKNGSEYVMEKFTYDEESKIITIYTDQYYVQNLSSVEIKKISYREEILAHKNTQ